MRRVLLTTLAVSLLSTLFLCGTAQAQRPTRYQPSRPTMTPYLQLLRRDPGVRGLGNYNNYFRPQQNIRNQFNRQTQGINRNRLNLQAQGTQVNNLGGEMQRIRQLGVAPTGTHGTFMNYGHYYSFGRARGAGLGRGR